MKSSEESIKARAVEAEQQVIISKDVICHSATYIYYLNYKMNIYIVPSFQSKFLKETLDEAASRHERLVSTNYLLWHIFDYCLD